MKYLILWDIHWQYEKLKEILDKHFSISDKVIFLGDYIDKNKDSLKTLDFLIELKKNNNDKVELLWWNHDIFMINSILYWDKKLFNCWFNLNNAYKTTLFDYVPWNDRVLFMDWYDEFVEEYFEKISREEYLIKLSQDLLDLWRLYYKDSKVFSIHWWLPLNIVNRNNFKHIDFYEWEWEESLINLEKDYKKWNIKASNFFWETGRNDPTWFAWAWDYEGINEKTFQELLWYLEVDKIFLWHRKSIKKPKFPKWDLLNCLNLW